MKKSNSKFRKILLTFLMIALFSLSVSGCAFMNSANDYFSPTSNKVEEEGEDNQELDSDIEYQITKKIVEYENLSVEDLQTAVNTAIAKVENSVIGITCKKVTLKSSGGLFGGPTSEVEANVSVGSGVIYKREEIKNADLVVGYKYYVMTNRHVIEGDDDEAAKSYRIYAYLGDKDVEIICSVVGYDEKVDIAVVTFESTYLLQPVEIADSNELEKGDFAIAVGNPDGYEYYGSATFGIISAPVRYVSSDTDDDGTDDFYCEYIQHDVAINPGNSGGGLFNLYGELIGINTLKLVSSTIDNMGFAIPSNTVTHLIDTYIEPGVAIKRARLGVLGSEVRALTSYAIENSPEIISIPDIYEDEAPYGIYVIEIYENTTMYNSDIKVNDIILAIDDVKITRTHIITAKLNSLVDFMVGDEVTVTYYSRSLDKITTTKVTLKGE